ncbi:MAG TPA: biopolymer transporter ExbD [Bryobacteraceae bacterium]|nr:biopolymer transporter ExbD [Bryobacteraceae bacterium]HOL71147.1 biopolymer transporter ExbD [Bryobacteraceae bacterium]HOQ44770.1 biopolymer transporter ExbD [Bryobacteraceae bacterium]HPQ17336.1 biopolymer transporter ExbD [Bryobacteraceae bacterium]HPU71980.1 biopolymer transporter ExbD [Bryobacteraceae bacterium]
MAFSFDGGLGRSRFRGTGSLAEINIIPLVDVVLVLLVIFMLTAHVMEFGMEVEVPKVRQTRDTAEELPVITVTKNGMLYLNDQAVNINELGKQVRAKFQSADAVYVRADKDTIWDVIAQVVSELNEAKFKVNMVTQPVDEAERKR